MESPEGQELLDELARCFVQAAVSGCSKSKRMAGDAQASEIYLSFIRTNTGGTV